FAFELPNGMVEGVHHLHRGRESHLIARRKESVLVADGEVIGTSRNVPKALDAIPMGEDEGQASPTLNALVRAGDQEVHGVVMHRNGYARVARHGVDEDLHAPCPPDAADVGDGIEHARRRRVTYDPQVGEGPQCEGPAYRYLRDPSADAEVEYFKVNVVGLSDVGHATSVGAVVDHEEVT